ncbi:MAG TPA: HDIG domain-containing protein [Kouleothrix sp.]|uniref:HD family phosphohydrolase n=1 Tax=Kouleothrix sp. TaxID=2779161 RepID=UPI002B543202|nr:HDIG domain-containing protein [Kouleothrix sp.]HRC74564.1 HDIG domain-containing protein [Kouleothrix sp.]
MRRKWGLRLGRSWRENRQLRAAGEGDQSLIAAQNEVYQRRMLVGVCVLLGLALWSLLMLRPLTNPNLQPGSPSPIEIRAPRTVSFASKLLTEQERIRVESAPDTVVYTRDPSIPVEQRAQLANALQTIEQIRNDPSLTGGQKRDKLVSLPLPSSTLAISPALALQLTRMPNDAWSLVRDQALVVYDRALSDHDYTLSEEDVRNLRERSMPYWSSLVARGEQQQLVLLFSEAFVRPNRLLDADATQARKQALRNQVASVLVTIQEGENIVHAGDIVTPAIQEKLEALDLLETQIDWLSVGGKGLLAGLLVGVFGIYVYKMQRNIWMVSRTLLVVAVLFALTALAARLALPLGRSWVYAFPLGMTALLLATLFPRGLALMLVTLLALVIAFLDDNHANAAVALLLGSMAGILTIGRGERWLHFAAAGLTIAVVTGLAQAAFWLNDPSGALGNQWLQIVLSSAINGVASAFIALGLFNPVGHLADVVTPQQLMELAHPAQPLLRKLIREAPGTYYHSLSVGNLAESAAEQIDADALLLRVASYYHDIGKTIRPYFFTDNQSDRENVHNDLDPHTSAGIICDHVTEGEKMARAAGLPRQVIEFIRAHHGTSVIKHFYQLALQQEDSVNVDDYRYPGPKPRTREQAIMMLADSVEATVRSKAQSGKIFSARDDAHNGNGRARQGMQTLEELVNSIIDERIRSGQLDESSLTLSDIAKIRQAFISTLQGIYHPRVDYAPQVVKHS